MRNERIGFLRRALAFRSRSGEEAGEGGGKYGLTRDSRSRGGRGCRFTRCMTVSFSLIIAEKSGRQTSLRFEERAIGSPPMAQRRRVEESRSLSLSPNERGEGRWLKMRCNGVVQGTEVPAEMLETWLGPGRCQGRLAEPHQRADCTGRSRAAAP